MKKTKAKRLTLKERAEKALQDWLSGAVGRFATHAHVHLWLDGYKAAQNDARRRRRQAVQRQVRHVLDSRPVKRKPRHKVGDVIRYGTGVTALMRVDHISKDHGAKGQHRYYGEQFFGSSVGVYEQDAKPATPEDLIRWKHNHPQHPTPAPTKGSPMQGN